MQRPLCTLCDARHYAYEPHVFPKETTKTTSRDLEAEVQRLSAELRQVKRQLAEANSKLAAVNMPANIVNSDAVNPVNAVNTAPVNRDRKQYMREYMRERRKAKAG